MTITVEVGSDGDLALLEAAERFGGLR